MPKLKNFLNVFWKIVFVLVFAVLIGAEMSGRFAVNLSSSIRPRLFYLVKAPVNVSKGDYVIFRPERMDPYIDGKMLVKKLTCDEGHMLSERGRDYFCDGNTFLGRAKVLSLKGHRLHRFYWSGVIPRGFCFVSGSNVNSYDSRYWGFLRKSDIKASAYPIF